MLGNKLIYYHRPYNGGGVGMWIAGFMLFYILRFTILYVHKERSTSVELGIRILWYELTLGNIIWDTPVEMTI